MLWAGRLSWLGGKTRKWDTVHSNSNSWQHQSAKLLLRADMWLYIYQWLHRQTGVCCRAECRHICKCNSFHSIIAGMFIHVSVYSLCIYMLHEIGPLYTITVQNWAVCDSIKMSVLAASYYFRQKSLLYNFCVWPLLIIFVAVLDYILRLGYCLKFCVSKQLLFEIRVPFSISV